ncbi:hypothetical protein OH146_07870 [Salinibacterium sp. SYSU T00001]|uniref:hypothetical protein n=1 Tax=Homoserinimonas sedimenticola TaxID=2986805 RepID=UPI002236AF1C|nr:hypothetical protein [Salinibacterium sedimenticola]MCW4385690.1 hypothetical protein [Salinibacterium sedimenticola]
MIDALLRRPHGAAEAAADVVRAAAPVSVLVAAFTFGWVEVAIMMLLFLGALIARAATLPPLVDALSNAVLLAAAWFAVVDLYSSIEWIDLATHFAVGGVLAALARVLLERWDAAGLAPALGRPSVASVVAGALVGACLALGLSVVWEFLEWWGHTYIDDGVNVGYVDTLGDLAAGGLGGLLAGALQALGRSR